MKNNFHIVDNVGEIVLDRWDNEYIYERLSSLLLSRYVKKGIWVKRVNYKYLYWCERIIFMLDNGYKYIFILNIQD